jgi:N6-adenosine-specific RNA methylase IME4
VSADTAFDLPDGQFDLIAADPPWSFKAFSERGMARAPERHYRTQPLDWIAGLPVADIAARNCHLMMWITGPMLVTGAHLPVMKAWGFNPSSIAFVWVKINKKAAQGRFFPPVSERDFFMSLGHTTRQNAEYVVLGRRGRPRRYDKAIHQLIVAPRREHSRKPDEFYERAERYAGIGARKVDLFGREQRTGWTVAGDEANKFGREAA